MENLSPQEYCIYFVIKGLLAKEGRTLIQGRFSAPLTPVKHTANIANPNPKSIEFQKYWKELWPVEFSSYRDQSPDHFLSTMRLKGLRQNAQLALLAFWQDAWPLIGRWDYPTPEELLAIQAEGYRVISILKDRPYSEMITPDKNNLEFTIHDLEHAAKYFEDPKASALQREQFKRLLRLKTEPLIQELIQQDLQFLKDWHYLISDMNTAPAHSWFFFRGTLLNAFKRRAQIPMTEKLPTEFEEQFSNFEEKACLEYFGNPNMSVK